MANSALTSIDSVPTLAAKTLRIAEPSAPAALANVAPGESAVVTSLELDADLVAWLRAVGIGLGDRITVLRRAAFGGPIHVRTAAGGEFALARSLARAILTSGAIDPARESETG